MNETNFEKACKTLGIDPAILPGTAGLSPGAARRVIAGYKLEIIYKAKVGKWKPNWNNGNQWKYTPCHEWSAASGSFVCTVTGYASTGTGLGARFWFRDAQTAREFGEQNIELINELHSED